MDSNFSEMNLHYLIQARDLTIRDLQRGAALLGIPEPMGQLLHDMHPSLLARFAGIRHPLIVPRLDTQWWIRLSNVLQEGDPEEIALLLNQAILITWNDSKETTA